MLVDELGMEVVSFDLRLQRVYGRGAVKLNCVTASFRPDVFPHQVSLQVGIIELNANTYSSIGNVCEPTGIRNLHIETPRFRSGRDSVGSRLSCKARSPARPSSAPAS